MSTDEPVTNNLINNLQNFPAGKQYPFDLKTSDGSYLHLADGRILLDCDCNSGVFSLGHRHPGVRAALENALGHYDMGNHHLISEPKGTLGKQLAELLPSGLTRTVFNVTQSEAVDVAVKLARGATGKPGIISAAGAYHGSTGFSMAASDSRFARSLNLDLPGFDHVPFNDLETLKLKLKENSGDVAAVMLEPVSVESGVCLLSPGYLKSVHSVCRKHGVLLIVDESVTGLGRSGKLFAIDRDGVTPDILIVGNALGGGMYPIHATCHTEKLDRFYVRNPFIHISTFGGSELGCFAAMAALKELSSHHLLKNVKKQSRVIGENLEKFQTSYPDIIVDIRQCGLLFGVEFVSESSSLKMISLLARHGIFCRCAAMDARTLLLLPPLNIQDSEVRALVDSFEAALREMPAISGGGSQ